MMVLHMIQLSGMYNVRKARLILHTQLTLYISITFSPYKPDVLFMGHMQTD